VLDRVSFAVRRGAALAVIGPNGSGKTVLLKALIGSVPYAGAVRWAADARLGYVPQKLDISRDVPITGADFLRARIALADVGTPRIADVLGAVGLPPPVAKLPIGTLSGGQFQRLLIAFALVGAPSVLLLDEPTVGVDEPGQERLNELVHRLQREHALTVLLVSHDLSVVYRYATDVLCLGHAVCFGPPTEILTPDLLREVYGSPTAFHVHDH
jgi:zinc transport system ATP-binding protein